MPEDSPPQPSSPAAEAGQTNVRIVYEETTAKAASQVIVNTGPDQVILNFSSGAINDPSAGSQLILPIHSRIAMTPMGVANLAQTLNTLLQQYSQEAAANPPEAPAAGGVEADVAGQQPPGA